MCTLGEEGAPACGDRVRVQLSSLREHVQLRRRLHRGRLYRERLH